MTRWKALVVGVVFFAAIAVFAVVIRQKGKVHEKAYAAVSPYIEFSCQPNKHQIFMLSTGKLSPENAFFNVYTSSGWVCEKIHDPVFPALVCKKKAQTVLMKSTYLGSSKYLLSITLPEAHSFKPIARVSSHYADLLLKLCLESSKCPEAPEYAIAEVKRYLLGEIEPDFAEICKEYVEWKKYKKERHWRWK